MNYLNIALRFAAAFITFTIGLALVGVSPNKTAVKPKPKATRADALDAELEAMNAFYKLIESNRKESELRTYVESSEDHFNDSPEGDFELIVGNELKPFEEIGSFYLTSSEYDPDKLQSYQVTPKGGILELDVEYPMEKIFVSPRRISFTTKSGETGISFQFTGNVEAKKYEEFDYVFKLIKGTLVKYQDGKEIFRSKVEFEEMSGC